MHKLCSITLLLLLLYYLHLSCYINYVFVWMTMGTGMWICFCFIIMKYTSDCEVKCDLDLFLIDSFLAHQSKSLCLAFRVWRLFSESRYLRRRSRAAVLHRSWSPCTTIWSRSSTPPATTSGRVCCEPVRSCVWSQFERQTEHDSLRQPGYIHLCNWMANILHRKKTKCAALLIGGRLSGRVYLLRVRLRWSGKAVLSSFSLVFVCAVFSPYCLLQMLFL